MAFRTNTTSFCILSMVACQKNIADKIIEICEKPQSELDDSGNKARQFVLEKKNNVVQAGKIIEMIKTKNDSQ